MYKLIVLLWIILQCEFHLLHDFLCIRIPSATIIIFFPIIHSSLKLKWVNLSSLLHNSFPPPLPVTIPSTLSYSQNRESVNLRVDSAPFPPLLSPVLLECSPWHLTLLPSRPSSSSSCSFSLFTLWRSTRMIRQSKFPSFIRSISMMTEIRRWGWSTERGTMWGKLNQRGEGDYCSWERGVQGQTKRQRTCMALKGKGYRTLDWPEMITILCNLSILLSSCSRSHFSRRLSDLIRCHRRYTMETCEWSGLGTKKSYSIYGTHGGSRPRMLMLY